MLLKKSLVFASAAATLAVACSTYQTRSHSRDVASIATWMPAGASSLSSGTLGNISSSGSMKMTTAKLITDNNRAFQSKLNIVRNAKRELRLSYFIYSDDFSSSLFNSELIAAARRGVKVKLLVDFITNYERMDLFSYLESVGQGNIEVRFYGMPTETILRGAVYETVPCSKAAVSSPNQCETEKKNLIAQLGNPQTTWFSKMFLTGLYGKNPTLLKTAVGIGGQFDPKTLQGGKPDAKQTAQLKEFGKLVMAAKFKGDVMAKMKVGMAMQMYGSTLNPVMNELTGRLPISDTNAKDWDHITDYTHHKLIVADGQRFQLGGRNIEDSYHTDGLNSQISEAKGKYTFMDTDFYGETAGAQSIEASYDRLFNFSPMVGGLQQVKEFVPFEYDANTASFTASLGACLQAGKATPAEIEACVNSKITADKNYKSQNARWEVVRNNMADKARQFAANYKVVSDSSWKSDGDTLSASDVSGLEAFYIENLTFNKNKPSQRIFGSQIGYEAESGKGIHAAWLKGLENVCATSAKSKQPKRVILHSAYLFLPSGLINALGNMMNGKWNCHYVDVTMITNSFQTTDLNVINIFARYQMQALFSYNKEIENNPGMVTANQYKAHFHYYEYNPSTKGSGLSLHTKVSVLGDDMIIGSANADIRSYFMDTNNGVYVRNAPEMVYKYTAFVDRIIAEQRVSDFTSFYSNVADQTLVAQNKAILRSMLEHWDSKGKINADRQAKILAEVDKAGSQIRQVVRSIIANPSDLGSGIDNDPQERSKKAKELDDMANQYDSFWKVL